MTAKTKKKLTITLIIIAVLLVAIIITSLALYLPRSVKKMMQNERIVSIVMVEHHGLLGIQEDRVTTLSQDKIDAFVEKAEKLTYVKRYNFLRLRCRPMADYHFVIKYETCELLISEVEVKLYHNKETLKIAYTELGMKPKDIYDELKNLFNN